LENIHRVTESLSVVQDDEEEQEEQKTSLKAFSGNWQVPCDSNIF